MKFNLSLYIKLFIFVFNTTLFAAQIQILHTNDLHSYLEKSLYKPHLGGYAQLKALLDELKEEAAQNGIPSLILDAGDFLEGNIFYILDDGANVLRALNMMGYEAVTLGNHDWLMGAYGLNHLLKRVAPTFPLLGANLTIKKYLYPSMVKYVKPYHIFRKANKNIAVLGLTTDNILYKWRFRGGTISNPIKVGRRQAKKLKKKCDLVIALTHLGLKKDFELAKKSKNIDLIIGGHSHTFVYSPYYKKNMNGKLVPIVQAGRSAQTLGRLLIDVNENNEINILDYKLIPVYSDGERDSLLEDYVSFSRDLLNKKYGEKWLNETIAYTDIPLTSSLTERTVWTDIVTDAIRESTQADVSIHSPGFRGNNLLPGELSREKIFSTYPRFFYMGDPYGWHIWKVKIYGFLIRIFFKLALRTDIPLNLSGAHIDLEEKIKDGKLHYKIGDIQIHGEKIRPFKSYTVALPEGLLKGSFGITKLLKFVFRQPFDSGISLWNALNEKVIKLGVITGNYIAIDDKGNTSDIDRTFIPVGLAIDNNEH